MSFLGCMTSTKRLREGVRRGEITCSVRIWTHPPVTVGKRYRMDDGEVEVDSITPIGFPDITPELARESGLLGVNDLLKWRNTVRAQISILSGFTMCARAKNRNPEHSSSIRTTSVASLFRSAQYCPCIDQHRQVIFDDL